MTIREETMKELCKQFSKIKGFKYSYKQLLTILEKNEFFKKKRQIVNENTPYKIFIQEQIERGIHLNIILDLWEKHKIKV